MGKSNRLSGISSLSYMGTNAQMPSNVFIIDRAPTANDTNFSLGDLWIYMPSPTANTNQLYILMGLAAGVADWDLVASNDGAMIGLLAGDGNTAYPSNGIVTLPNTSNISTTASGSSLSVSLNNSVSISGNYTTTAGNINLPGFNSAGTQGIIKFNDVRFITTDGTSNQFLGFNAGNTTLSGSNNIIFGSGSLGAATTCSDNLLVGNQIMTTATSAGSFNTVVGSTSFQIGTGINNSILGGFGLTAGTTGSGNSTLGYSCGYSTGGATGMTTGSFNTLLGYTAGSAFTSSESSNICINSIGVASDSNVMRIGGATGTGDQQLNACFIAGIRGITTAVNDAVAVLIDSADQLGTVSSSLKYKENVSDLGKDSEVIYSLRPVKFNFKKHPNVPSWGLIAEEVSEVFPQLAVYKDGEPESVKYHDLPVLLLNELQKLSKRVEELEQKLTCSSKF